MTSVTYDSFFPEVLPYVHDCPEIVAINAIRNTCIEFCDKSHYYIFEHDPIVGLAGVSSYDLDLPTGTTAARILDAWYDNNTLEPKSEDDLKRIFPLNWRTMEGQPSFYMSYVPDTVIISPTPSITETGALTLLVAIKPTRASTTIDSTIYERWAEQIGFGARARLYDTPNQPYADPAQAVKFRGWFESAIGEAKIERNRGLTRTTLRVRPPRLV